MLSLTQKKRHQALVDGVASMDGPTQAEAIQNLSDKELAAIVSLMSEKYGEEALGASK